MLKLAKKYWQSTDKLYVLLCIGCSAFAVLVLLSIGKYHLGGFQIDELEGTRSLGGYRQAVVQAAASCAGILCAIVVSLLDYRALAKLWPVHVLLTWGLVATTFLRGRVIGGITFGYAPSGTDNHSWILLPGFSLQPTELAKISFILTFALHLDTVHERMNEPKELLGLLAHMLLPVLIIHEQGDDGTGLIFLAIGCIMLFVAGLSWKYILSAAALGVSAFAVVLGFFSDELLKGYQFMRIMAVFYPDDPTYAEWTYQQNQGKVSIGAGQIIGRGLFGEEHNYVVNSWNDFIFSYIAEAVGFVGCMILLAVLLTIAVKTLTIGLRSQDKLGTYICTGVFAAFIWQIVINLGMNLGVLPVIGVTLPFLSAGGSSVLMLYLCIGLVLSVYTHNKTTLFSEK